MITWYLFLHIKFNIYHKWYVIYACELETFMPHADDTCNQVRFPSSCVDSTSLHNFRCNWIISHVNWTFSQVISFIYLSIFYVWKKISPGIICISTWKCPHEFHIFTNIPIRLVVVNEITTHLMQVMGFFHIWTRTDIFTHKSHRWIFEWPFFKCGSEFPCVKNRLWHTKSHGICFFNCKFDTVTHFHMGNVNQDFNV